MLGSWFVLKVEVETDDVGTYTGIDKFYLTETKSDLAYDYQDSSISDEEEDYNTDYDEDDCTVNNNGDFVVIMTSSNVTFTPNLSKISTIASSPCGISPKFISIVSPSPNKTFAAKSNARLEKSDGIENVVGL